MQEKMDIPDDFSGLLYGPSDENGVYLLMGMLWHHLPYKFSIEAFEINPDSEPKARGKWLDARGRWYNGTEWEKATFEFKLQSSGFRKDMQQFSGIYVDFLICWEHDAPGVGGHVGKVISLREIYNRLPSKERGQIVFYPDQIGKFVATDEEVDRLLAQFSTPSRAKVEALIEHWPQISAGKTELLFKVGRRTAFRAYSYRAESLMVKADYCPSSRDKLVRQYYGEGMDEGVKIPLAQLPLAEIESLVATIRGGLM